jgi:hypothetical protein
LILQLQISFFRAPVDFLSIRSIPFSISQSFGLRFTGSRPVLVLFHASKLRFNPVLFPWFSRQSDFVFFCD